MCWTVGAAALKGRRKVAHLSAWKRSSNCTQTQQVSFWLLCIEFNCLPSHLNYSCGILFLAGWRWIAFHRRNDLRRCLKTDTRVVRPHLGDDYVVLHTQGESWWMAPRMSFLFWGWNSSRWRNFFFGNESTVMAIHTHPDPVTWETTDRLCSRTSIFFSLFSYSARCMCRLVSCVCLLGNVYNNNKFTVYKNEKKKRVEKKRVKKPNKNIWMNAHFWVERTTKQHYTLWSLFYFLFFFFCLFPCGPSYF